MRMIGNHPPDQEELGEVTFVLISRLIDFLRFLFSASLSDFIRLCCFSERAEFSLAF